jgi:hypothetical protein
MSLGLWNASHDETVARGHVRDDQQLGAPIDISNTEAVSPKDACEGYQAVGTVPTPARESLGAPYHVCRPLRDDDRGRIRVTARYGRHDRRVRHTEVRRTVNT